MADVHTPEGYADALETFDATVCEALAVGQGTAERWSLPHVGYGTYLFARMCAHGVSMVRAAPRSRWVQSDNEDWNFSCVAPHARALLEGYQFFLYLMDEPSGEPEWRARISVLQLNDCTRRLELMSKIEENAQAEEFAKLQEELRERLRTNEYFRNLPERAQQSILKGDKPYLKTREQLLEMAGLNKQQYDALWIFYSQHCHILPLSFYRMEPNGRGSGLENEVDRGYIGQALLVGASVLAEATEQMVLRFPDAQVLRKGIASKFRPGPKANLPVLRETTSLTEIEFDKPRSVLARNIDSYLKVMYLASQ